MLRAFSEDLSDVVKSGAMKSSSESVSYSSWSRIHLIGSLLVFDVHHRLELLNVP